MGDFLAPVLLMCETRDWRKAKRLHQNAIRVQKLIVFAL